MIRNALRRWGRNYLVLAIAVGMLTALQGVASVAAKSERWSGHWANTSVALAWATTWGSCIAAAAAAWVVAEPRWSKYNDLLRASSRSQARVLRAGLLSVALGSLAGYAVVIGYLCLATATVATHGSPDLIAMFGALATIALAVGLGALCGRAAPPIIAPVIAGVSPILVYMMLIYASVYGGDGRYRDLIWVDQVDRDYLRLPWELVLSRGLFWALLGVTLVCVAVYAYRVAYRVVLAAALALAVVLVTVGAREVVPAAYAAICLDGPPKVCVDRAHDHIAADYRDRVVAAFGRIPGFEVTNLAVVQREDLIPNSVAYQHGDGGVGSATLVVIPLVKRNTAPAHEVDGGRFNATFGSALFLRQCFTATGEGTDPGRITAAVLYLWWLNTNNLPTDGSNYPGEFSASMLGAESAAVRQLAAEFTGLSESARAAWFTDQRAAILSCRAVMHA